MKKTIIYIVISLLIGAGIWALVAFVEVEKVKPTILVCTDRDAGDKYFRTCVEKELIRTIEKP